MVQEHFLRVTHFCYLDPRHGEGYFHEVDCGAIVLASPQYLSDTFGVLSLVWVTKRHKLSE